MAREMINPLAERMGPLFAILPLEKAMPHLLFRGSPSEQLKKEIEGLRSFYPHPGLQIGIWLYADCFTEAHTIAQGLETPIGSYWHGILHRREGDYWNAKYWLRRAGTIRLQLAYDPYELVDLVEKSEGVDIPELVEAQRAEWLALFRYCLDAGAEDLGDVEQG